MRGVAIGAVAFRCRLKNASVLMGVGGGEEVPLSLPPIERGVSDGATRG